MSPDQIYCKIIEYEISWPANINDLKPHQLLDLRAGCLDDDGNHESKSNSDGYYSSKDGAAVGARVAIGIADVSGPIV